MMKVVTFNCKNFKSHYKFVEKLINENYIIFIIVHWLKPKEKFMINNILSDHKLIFQSDMVDSSKLTRGRPFGGKCWVIRYDVNSVSYEHFNDIISIIKIYDGNGKFIYLFGAWIQFDDGSIERVSELVSAFSLIESYI